TPRFRRRGEVRRACPPPPLLVWKGARPPRRYSTRRPSSRWLLGQLVGQKPGGHVVTLRRTRVVVSHEPQRRSVDERVGTTSRTPRLLGEEDHVARYREVLEAEPGLRIGSYSVVTRRQPVLGEDPPPELRSGSDERAPPFQRSDRRFSGVVDDGGPAVAL